MPTINLEMMKQLLEEFSEKEALTTEEINVIEREISTLEQRISFCHNKLKNLSTDKDKLTAMKERYIKGNFSQYIQAVSLEMVDQSNVQTAIVNSIPTRAVSGDIKSSDSKATNQPNILNKTQDKPVSEAKATDQTIVPQAHPSALSPANNEPSTQAAEEETATNKESGEPIKSINEALKGLFRK